MDLPESIPVPDAASRLAELLDRVERGERIAITRNGAHVATLIPGGGPAPNPAAAARRILERRTKIQSEGRGASLDEILAARNTGRR